MNHPFPHAFTMRTSIVLLSRMNCTATMILLAGLLLAVPATAAPENLLRNGSFEGGMLYWHNLGTNDYSLVRGSGVVGEYALCLKQGFAMSAPFVAQRGEPFTVSFFVKGDKPGTVEVAMPPSAREVGQKAKRLWTREGGQSAKFSTQWQRVSFTWPADVPQDGFWPNPHYLVQIGGGGTSLPIYIDGVTVTQGREGTSAYVPRRADRSGGGVSRLARLRRREGEHLRARCGAARDGPRLEPRPGSPHGHGPLATRRLRRRTSRRRSGGQDAHPPAGQDDQRNRADEAHRHRPGAGTRFRPRLAALVPRLLRPAPHFASLSQVRDQARLARKVRWLLCGRPGLRGEVPTARLRLDSLASAQQRRRPLAERAGGLAGRGLVVMEVVRPGTRRAGGARAVLASRLIPAAQMDHGARSPAAERHALAGGAMRVGTTSAWRRSGTSS